MFEVYLNFTQTKELFLLKPLTPPIFIKGGVKGFTIHPFWIFSVNLDSDISFVLGPLSYTLN